MALTLGIIGVAACWTLLAFTLLQLQAERRQQALLATLALLAGGILVAGMRTGHPGLAWIRAEHVHSDALALGAIVPTVAIVGMVLACARTPGRWMLPVATAAGLGCALAGVAGVDIGRSGWYWEFVAIVVAGCCMLAAGSSTALRSSAGPNLRLVAGSVAAVGVFLAVGGTMLGLAWRAIAG